MNNRNCNIDILRFISMTLVTCIHFLCYNDMYGNQDMPIYNRLFFDTIVTLTNCFVNLFVLISGYLLCNKDFKVSRIVSTWSLVWVSCFTTALVVCLVNPSGFSLKGVVRSIFPILSGSYWYIISYFLLLLVAPFINSLFVKYNERQIRTSLISIGVLLTVVMGLNPMIKLETYVGSSSALPWFCYIYAIGGYIKTYGIRHKPLFRLLGGGSFLLMLAVLYLQIKLPGGISVSDQTGVFCLVLSIAIFDLIASSNIKNSVVNKILSNGIIGKSALCVYIIQENYFFRNWFWTIVEPFQYKDSPMLIVVWLLCVVLFWILACLMYKWYGALQRVFLKKFEDKISDTLLLFVEKCKLKIA